MTAAPESTPNSPDPAAAAPSLPRRRFQFSLATLLWLTTVVACLAAIWVMYREVRQAKAELRVARDEVEKYRGEMGYLNVVDRSKLYARGVTKTATNRRSWRVYIPEGAQYWVRASTSEIPLNGFPLKQQGFPPTQSDMTIESGEHLINLNEEGSEGKCHFFIKIVDGSGISVKGAAAVGGDVDGVGTYDRRQMSATPESGLVLLRSRKENIAPGSPQGFATGQDSQPRDGLMIWIEEAKR